MIYRGIKKRKRNIIKLNNQIKNVIKEEFEEEKSLENENIIEESLKRKGKFATCKIITNKSNGIGFFCIIPLHNIKIKVLFTNNHILNEDLLSIGNEIKLSYKYQFKKIKLTNERIFWTNKSLDYSIIEILDNDEIEEFYEIEYKSYNNPNKIYENDDIGIIQYLEGGQMEVKINRLLEIKNEIIKHNILTNNDSSGSPLILLKNLKIIGINQGSRNKQKIGIGIFINSIIEDINNNIIICEYNIGNYNIGKEINILSNSIEENKLKEICYFYLNNEKIEPCFKYKFKKEGKYILKIIFKEILSSMNKLFNKCSSLISLDLSKLYSRNIKNMEFMFSNCSSLKSLNLSNFNTFNVTNMNSMFNSCSSLTSLDLSSFNTINVEIMSGMFSKCNSLISLDLFNFNTKKVKNMNGMFYNCSSLITLDLSYLNTKNVNNMQGMLAECSSLTSLNLSNFNTINVKDMSYMFYNCSSLISLNLSNFNIINVKDMNNIFSECSSLISLDLSNFHTNNVINMEYMFYNCSSLTSLNISNFNTNNVNNMGYVLWLFFFIIS